MGRSVSFHTLETYYDNDYQSNEVFVSFKTRTSGIYQISYDGSLNRLRNEPPLHTFTKNDQNYIESVCKIVYLVMYNNFP